MNLLQNLWNPLSIIKKFTLWGGGSGGGGAPTQTTSTSYQTNIPQYAQPYVETMLGATQQQLFQTQPNAQGGTDITGFTPYKAYGGTYDASGNMVSYDPSKGVAGFSPMQQAAQQGISNLQVPGQYAGASQATAAGILGAMDTQYNAPQYTNQFQAPGQYQPTSTGFQNVSAPDLTTYQMPGVQNVYTGAFNQPGTARSYMNPYLQSALAPQMALLGQQQAQQGQQLASQASQAGAFGGSRYGIQQGLQNQANQLAMSNLVGQGYNQAYQNAMQQYSTDAARQLAAQQANQQAGLTTQQQNLAAALGVQQLGAGQNLQAQLANQQAQQAANQLAAQQQQFGYGQQMTAAQQAAQYGLSAQQLAAQQQQFGANLGMQGIQTGLQGAGQLANIGGQQLQAQQGILGLQNQTGAQQQAYQQQILNQAMQDYANTQQYPLMELGFMSNMLRGLPMQAASTQQYVAQPNYLTQGIGALGAGASIYNAFNGAKGGVIKEMAKGGITSVPSYDVGGQVYSDLVKMEPDELKEEIKTSPSQQIKNMAQGILTEKMMQTPSMYSGGIVAFADGTTDGRTAGDYYLGPSSEATAGEAEAKQNIQARQAQSPEGILGAAPPTPPPPAGSAVMASNLPDELKGIYSEQIRQSQMSVPDIMAERKAALAAAGVPDVSAARLQQIQNIQADRAEAMRDAERDRNLRLASFFAQWGSTPGGTLVAGLRAFRDHAEPLIAGEKEAKKYMRDLDKSIADLEEASRLEQVGKVEEAFKVKEGAKGIIQKLNEKVFDIGQQKLRDQATAEREKARDIATGEREKQHDVYYRETQLLLEKEKAKNERIIEGIRAAGRSTDRADAAYTRAVDLSRNVEATIANERNKPEYAENRRLAGISPEGQSPQMQDRINKAKEFINNTERDFNTMRSDAKEAVDRARAKAEGRPYTPTTNDRAPGDRPPISSFGGNQPAPAATSSAAPAPAPVEDNKKYIREKNPRGAWVYTESPRGQPMSYYRQKDTAKE